MEEENDKQKRAWDALFYSDKRIDVLLISISSAGIYVCLETLKFFTQEKLPSPQIIKYVGMLFVFGIITNIISQFTGKYSNHYYYLFCEKDEENETNKNKKESYDLLSRCFDKLTTLFNYLNAILLVIGLFGLIYFFMGYL